MEQTEYLTFDEAVEYLKTTPSTLYKWLQAGRVPGHKLGRQWRFLRDELRAYRAGTSVLSITQDSLKDLSEALFQRARKRDQTRSQARDSKRKKEKTMAAPVRSLTDVSKQVLWEAVDDGSREIHLQPIRPGHYQITYRRPDGLEKLITIDESLFRSMDETWQKLSAPIKNANMRRLFLSRGEDHLSETIQVRYQKVETIAGARLTLHITGSQQDLLPLEKIVTDKKALADLEAWCKARHGLIVVSGASGSGKTTTVYSLLDRLSNEDRIIFTLEDPVEVVIEGINQVEVSAKDKAKFIEAFEAVYDSDPDVIVLGLGAMGEAEDTVLSCALEAASTGHLVLLQLGASSLESALQKLEAFNFGSSADTLLGVSHQRLHEVSKGKFRVEIETKSGPRSQTKDHQ